MDERSQTRKILKSDKFILQVVNEIKKKITPLSRSNSIFKNNNWKSNEIHVCSKSSFNKSQRKLKSTKKLGNRKQIHRNSLNSRNSEINSYESLQRKVHNHIVMRRLHLIQNKIIQKQKENIEQSQQEMPIMGFLKKFQRGQKQISQHDVKKNKTFLAPQFETSRICKTNTYTSESENRTLSEIQKRLKKLIQRDILEEYKKQKMTKIMLSINHRKMISLR